MRITLINLNQILKKTWDLINSLIRPGSNRKGITNIFYNNQFRTSDNNITSAFNIFFVNIGKELTESFNEQYGGNEHLQFLQQTNYINSFFFSPGTNLDINEIILLLKNKSGDRTSFNTKTRKCISPVISPVHRENWATFYTNVMS